jgi:heme o synthase
MSAIFRPPSVAAGSWGGAGPVYVVCALALGAVFVGMAEKLRRDTTPRRAMLLFHYSLLYLALIFAALALDAAI